MKDIDPLNKLFNLEPFSVQKQENLPAVQSEPSLTVLQAVAKHNYPEHLETIRDLGYGWVIGK